MTPKNTSPSSVSCGRFYNIGREMVPTENMKNDKKQLRPTSALTVIWQLDGTTLRFGAHSFEAESDGVGLTKWSRKQAIKIAGERFEHCSVVVHDFVCPRNKKSHEEFNTRLNRIITNMADFHGPRTFKDRKTS